MKIDDKKSLVLIMALFALSTLAFFASLMVMISFPSKSLIALFIGSFISSGIVVLLFLTHMIFYASKWKWLWESGIKNYPVFKKYERAYNIKWIAITILMCVSLALSNVNIITGLIVSFVELAVWTSNFLMITITDNYVYENSVTH